MDTLLLNLIGLFLLIGTGFLAVRTKLLPAGATAPLSALLMKITLPATIFSAMLRPFDPAFLKDSIIGILLCFALYGIFGAVAWVGCRLLRVADHGRGAWMLCATFPNNGFMGFPIILALFGDDGLALAAMMNIPFNLMLYTLGTNQVLQDAPTTAKASFSWKNLLCTGINASIVLGLIFFCLQIPVPAAVLTPIQNLANITTPLSMLLIGMTLAKGNVREVFRDKDVFTGSAMRLLLLPVLTWIVLMPLPISTPLVSSVILVSMAMPSAAISPVLAEQNNGNGLLASGIVFMSSLLCLVTIPLITLLP